MLQAHGLEITLGTLLICHATFSPDLRTSRDAKIAQVRRLTLGALIEQFVKVFSPEQNLIEELDNLLFFRNELAHRISDTIVSAATRVNWEQRVLTELEEIRSYFVDVKPLFEPYMEAFRAQIGITEEQMLELARKAYPGAA